MEGGGFATRGALFPGVPFVVIGRGIDDVWSATSSQADNTDVFVETLCGDDTHYMVKGTCRAMTTFNAGVLSASGAPDQPVTFRETVHGPVEGYATVDGARVAVSLERSTRGRELLSSQAFYKLDTNQVDSARSFVKAMAGVEFSFNWFYADDRDIALFSSGRLPVRAPGTDPALPTDGSGAYDWRGFLTPAQHAQAIDPANGEILNWNNKPAANVGASDDNWSFGPIQRVQLLQRQLDAKKGKLTLADVASAMNGAATQDLRAVLVLPDVAAVLKTGAAPGPRAAQMLQLLEDWAAQGREPARPEPRRQGRRPRRGDHGRRLGPVGRRRDDPGAGADAGLAGSPLSTSAATTRTRAARRTSTAGTATSTRTSARCSASR